MIRFFGRVSAALSKGAISDFPFRVKILFLVIPLVLMGGIANAQSGNKAPPQVVDEEYWTFTLTDKRNSRPLTIYYKPYITKDGSITICAATINSRKSIHKRVLQAVKISLNDQVILRSFRWAPNHRTTGIPIGLAAACRLTKAIASKTDNQFSADLSKNRF